MKKKKLNISLPAGLRTHARRARFPGAAGNKKKKHISRKKNAKYCTHARRARFAGAAGT
jgi:hypothetical protein